MQQCSTKIRDAHLLDLLPITVLAEKYMQEVQCMDNHPISIKALMDNLAATIINTDGCLRVLEVDGVIVGGMWGFICSQFWSEARMAQDVILFVSKEHRGRYGRMIIKDWEQWAKEKGAVEVLLSTASGINTKGFGSLAKHLGYAEAGNVYKKEITNGF